MHYIKQGKDMKLNSSSMFATLLAGAVAAPAGASDYGCQVLLCLANPAGPMAVAECVPPIKKLFRDLAKGRGFPHCAMSSGPSGGTLTTAATYAAPVRTEYDACPPGTSPARQGAYVADGYIVTDGDRAGEIAMTGGAGVSQPHEGAGEAGCSSDYNGTARACVGRYLGEVDGASVYSRVVWQQPSAPNTIRVYVDGVVYQNVTW